VNGYSAEFTVQTKNYSRRDEMNRFKTGIIQMEVSGKKEENVKKAVCMIAEAARKGAELIVLPEMFNCPYKADDFPVYAERQGGYTWGALSKSALENNIYLVGGSIPEADDEGKVYNTCFTFNRKGEQIGRHRKMHLFDVNITGGQVFKESDTLTAGDDLIVFDTEFCKMGVVICYDIRFPETSRLLTLKGAKVIAVPAAFNMTSGPAHWEISFRARALDNQVYMIGASSARNLSAGYIAYGNSIVSSPWGNVIGRLDEKEGILITEIDLDLVEKVRNELPLLRHRRTDIYSLEERGC
jgi:omega-amidase